MHLPAKQGHVGLSPTRASNFMNKLSKKQKNVLVSHKLGLQGILKDNEALVKKGFRYPRVLGQKALTDIHTRLQEINEKLGVSS